MMGTMKPRQMTVGDLMTTALVTVRASELVTDAHAEMESGAIRHLPVVDERGHLVGVLSDRDLLRAAIGIAKRTPRIGELMTREIVSLRPEAPAARAAELMIEHKIGSVPVVDEQGALVGIVTQTDYLEVARRALLGLTLER